MQNAVNVGDFHTLLVEAIHPLVEATSFTPKSTTLTADEITTMKVNFAIFQYAPWALFYAFIIVVAWVAFGMLNKYLVQILNYDVLKWLHRFN